MVTRKFSGTVRLALASVVILTAGSALAEVKYNRKTRDIKVEATEATKKMEAKKDSDKKEKGPDTSITADQYMQIEAAVQDINEQLIAVYKRQLEGAEDDDERRPEYAFRLAEAYAQNVRFHHFKAMEALLKQDKAKTKPERDKWKKEQTKEEKEKMRWLKDTVTIYQIIVDNKSKMFKKFARMDEVLFYYAFTLNQAGYGDQARTQYKRLLKEYQNSKFIPDAYLSFAEYYFEQKSMNDAELYYDKVLKFPKSSVYPYAMYKKGWVYFNLNQHDDAMKVFFDVVQITKNDKKNEPMNRAARKDFVRMYAEVGDVKLAYKAFQRVVQGIDDKYAFTMLGFLGDYYVDQGKAEKAIYTFREMISMEPKDKRVCEWETTVVRAMLTIGSQQDKVKEVQNLAKLYKFLKDGNIVPEANLSECKDNAESISGELAKLWHVEGLKTLNPDTLGYADLLYTAYVDHFPDAADLPDMVFNHAELVWKRAEMEKNNSKQAVLWESAAERYRRVVEMKKVDPKLLKEAAYATVLAWKNALAIDPSTEAPEETNYDKVPEPKKIDEKEEKMMAAFDIYLTYVQDRKDNERTLISFLKGRIYWKNHHFDKCIPLFSEVIETNPDHEVAEFAAILLLDSFNRGHKYDELITWVDKLLAMPKFLAEHPEIESNVKKLKRQSLRKYAEQLEKDGKYRECGFAYEDMYERYKMGGGDDLADILFNAAVCFEKAKLIGRAVLYRRKLIDEYGPKKPNEKPTKQVAQAQYAIGLNYAQIAQYENAAKVFELYANKFGGESNAKDALQNATFFRKGLGQDDDAIKDTNFFIKQYGSKQPKEAAAAHYSIASIYEKNKAWDQFTKHLATYLKQWGSKGGVDRQIIAHVKIGEVRWRESCPVKGVDGACVELRRERALKQQVKKKGKKKFTVDQTRCGDMSKMKVIIHERKPGLVKEAQSHFNTALKLWKDGKAANDIPGKDDAEKAARTAEAIYAVAQATYYLTEQKYEQFLTISFPEKLDFSAEDPEWSAKKKKEKKKIREDSVKRFTKYLADKSKGLAAASDKYAALVNRALEGGAAINGAAWAIAAAARYGQLYQNFADQLWTATIPDDLRKGEFAEDAVAAFCDTLADGFRDEQGNLIMNKDNLPVFAGVNALEEESVKGFSFCLDTSTKLNWFNQWTKLCEGELAQIRPQDYPAASEVRAKPEGTPMILDTQPIATELADSKKPTAAAAGKPAGAQANK